MNMLRLISTFFIIYYQSIYCCSNFGVRCTLFGSDLVIYFVTLVILCLSSFYRSHFINSQYSQIDEEINNWTYHTDIYWLKQINLTIFQIVFSECLVCFVITYVFSECLVCLVITYVFSEYLVCLVITYVFSECLVCLVITYVFSECLVCLVMYQCV